MDRQHPYPAPTSADGPLTTGEGMALLRSVPTGRLVYTDNALPAVRPVTFAAPDADIVIPTGQNPWFHRFDGVVLGFEAGIVDPATRTGWTVLVIGRSRLVVGAGALAGFDDSGSAPWNHHPGECYLAIDIGHLEGHRTTLARLEGDHR